MAQILLRFQWVEAAKTLRDAKTLAGLDFFWRHADTLC